MLFTRPDSQSDHVYAFDSGAIDGSVYCWCPTMDLIAVSALSGKALSLYRMNGCKVCDIETDKVIKTVEWKPDGKQLCVVTLDDVATLYDVNSNRLLSQLKSTESINLTKWIVMNGVQRRSKFHGTLDVDIWKALPKLTHLPSANNSNKFSTKQAIDTMIQNDQADDMDLLFAFGEKSVNVTLHGLFSLGPVPVIGDGVDEENIVNCQSHALEDHYILTSSFTTMRYTLRKFKTQFLMNFDFFSQITTNSSKIIALLGYIEEVLVSAGSTIRSYLDDHNRFLNVLRNELNEEGLDMGDELYSLLLTGMMNDHVKDWIQNSIADRNIKRWTSSGDTVYNNTRRTFTFHLIPACERMIILLTNLQALSKGSVTLTEEFEIGLLNDSIESIKKLLKLLFDFTFKLNEEQELFNEYMVWLQYNFMELQDDSCSIEYSTSKVAEYINTHLERPVLVTIVPFMRRNYNEIKINTQDMFDSIKSKIRENVVRDDSFQLTLGRVTEKQHMRFVNDDLYVFSYYDSTLEISKVDVDSQVSISTCIEFADEITDVQIVDDENLLVASRGKVKGFAYQYLFNQQNHSIDSISLIIDESIPGLRTKYLTINPTRNIGCAISEDLKNYSVFLMQ